jgi:hypothetical protein
MVAFGCPVGRGSATVGAAVEADKGPQDFHILRALVSYALTTLPLRRQEVQTRMCLVAAPTLA